MNLIEHIRSMTGASEHFDDVIGLQERYDAATDPTERAGIAAAAADRWEAIAAEAQASRLTRVLFSAWKPEQFRAEVAEWRAKAAA